MAKEETKSITAAEESPVGDLDAIFHEIKQAYKRLQTWRRRANEVETLYRGEGDGTRDSDAFKILWTVTEIQRPLLYSNTAKPDIRRRYKDKNEAARIGAETMERVIQTAQTLPGHEFDNAMKKARDDFLIAGRGQCRVKYNASFNKDMVKVRLEQNEVARLSRKEKKKLDKDAFGFFRKEEGPKFGDREYEEVFVEYIHWRDFLHSDGLCWDDVWWVAFGSWMTRSEVVKNFGKDIADKVPTMRGARNDDDEQTLPVMARGYKGEDRGHDDFARIWEFWDKRTRQVFFVAEGCDEFLMEPLKDPLGLKQFFPCPKPIDMIETTGSMEPIPEYKMYEHQASIVNELSGRIHRLQRAIVARGIYDSEFQSSVGQLFRGTENTLLPDPEYGRLIAAGGKDAAITWMPVAQFAETLSYLMDARQTNLDMIYEIIGLADIMRGTTNPREPAKTQRMKLEQAIGDQSRIGEKRQKVEYFARDCIRLMTEIVAEIFDAETIILMAGATGDDQEHQLILQGAEEALKLFRGDSIRNFTISVESESTVAPDETKQKEELNEFIQSIMGLIQGSAQAAQAGLMAPDLLQQLIMFSIRHFKHGRRFEDDFEASFAQIQQQQEEASKQQQQAMQAEQQKEEQQFQLDLQKEQAKIQNEQAKLMVELEKLKLEYAKLQVDADIEYEKIEQKMREALINLEVVKANRGGGGSGS